MVGPNEKLLYHRLLNVNWRQVDSTRRGSQRALFVEYLRRVGVWCVALHWENAHPIISDIPRQLMPDVFAAPVNTTLLQQTMRTVGRTSIYERMTVTRALNMAAIVDHARDDLPYGLPDLYIPLMVFFERGGGFTRNANHNRWVVAGEPWTMECAGAYATATPLNIDGDLDRLDTPSLSHDDSRP